MIMDEIGRIPMSPYLSATLARAAGYAADQAHAEVTIEHLLLALAEDPEATVVLKSSDIDLLRLGSDVSGYLGRIEDRSATPGQPVQLSADLKRILEAAAAAAQQGRRREINGAIVLAAIVGEGKSPSAQMLRAQGLTFEAAIAALKRATAAAAGEDAIAAAAPVATPAPPAPSVEAPRSTGDILAKARERVEQRSRTAPPQLQPQPQVMVPSAAEPRAAQQPAPTTPIPEAWPAAANAASAPASAANTPVQSRPAPAPSLPPQYDPARAAEGAAAPPSQWTPPPKPVPGPQPAAPPPRMNPAAFQPQAPAAPPAMRPVGGMAPMPAPPAPSAPGMRPPPPLQSPPPWSDGRTAARGAEPPPTVPMRAPSPDARGMPGLSAGTARTRVESGRLVENIPRRMRVAVPQLVEVRIAKESVKQLSDTMQGGGPVHPHRINITKAMSVRLRAPEGGFWIEGASPDTQWIENMLGGMADDYASWRWTITPKVRGTKRLQIIIAARTMGEDGIVAETAFPDQTIEVRVTTNYALSARRWGGWIAAAVAGGLLARFGEGAFDAGAGLVSRLMGA